MYQIICTSIKNGKILDRKVFEHNALKQLIKETKTYCKEIEKDNFIKIHFEFKESILTTVTIPTKLHELLY